tara:strand:- start:201 stop:488 length:288 start_codon:yes stop_codon:yes gene_type:complete
MSVYDALRIFVMSNAALNDAEYYIYVDFDTGRIDLRCIGMSCVDMVVEGQYASVDELPKDIGDKLLMLMVLESHAVNHIEGVGRRYGENKFIVEA